MRKFFFPVVLIKLSCVFLLAFSCGCEEDSDTEQTETYFEDNPYSSTERPATTTSDALAITPEFASLSADGEAQLFKASGGTPPYTWSVQDISRGSIVEEGAKSAVYQRSSAGNNIIQIQDKSGNKVFATADQP